MQSYKHKRLKKAGNLTDLQLRLWQAVDRAEEILLTTDCKDRQLRAIHSLTAAAGQYLKILEATEIDKRITAIEEKLYQ